MFDSLTKSSLLALSFVTTLVVSSSAPEGAPTECFILTGQNTLSAGYRCNNGTTGHSTCCAPGAICFSNGVCQQGNSNIQDFLRVGCTDPTWNDPACLKQCSTFGTDTAGIRFCNGAITATTAYCCDNGTTGIGSFACCDSPNSIFNIAPAPTVLAQIPLNPPSPSSSISPTTASTSASPASNAAMTLPSVYTSPSRSAVAVAVAIPISILALVIIGFLVHRNRKSTQSRETFRLSTFRARDLGPGEPKMGSPEPKSVEQVHEMASPIDENDDVKKGTHGKDGNDDMKKRASVTDDEDDDDDGLTDKDIEAGFQRPVKVFEMA